MGQQRLQLRSKHELAAANTVVKRLDSYTIARQHQLAFVAIPNRHRKHAIQITKTVDPSPDILLQDDFCVRSRAKSVAISLKRGAQFNVVISFSVVDQRIPSIRRAHWLRTTFEVDDAQSTVAQRNRGIGKGS